jgi:hypothetical protein
MSGAPEHQRFLLPATALPQVADTANDAVLTDELPRACPSGESTAPLA